MFVLFVGGRNNGLTQHLPDDQTELYVALIGTETRDLYVKVAWQGGGSRHGYDALFIHGDIPLESYEEAIEVALKNER